MNKEQKNIINEVQKRLSKCQYCKDKKEIIKICVKKSNIGLNVKKIFNHINTCKECISNVDEMKRHEKTGHQNDK
jgi:hypothetical protein